ncbi:MAG: 16S rRNA (guanine(966)-N(2))-methyltransferase RsmD [Alphaproteobacteria bacterium]|nr:16S rRNA (guanine(966)-N(2))-methyltransferase RsmD [Alphaproteobacteria bacterium]MBU0795877.1 16S rRNA (guanine(966)-N(2))-methyltransferase RsmD [Alphaproteobacteria bacterium]MBU0888587.1 16S rRNA (guanine(966)-N(2))-methyltransferase RsmD [Alphaproteobacteria bacterium]MBU1813679.1 16S rRNA (guanine(966)-N(2))-methyltransferase RsmD [Alphaproteobacteria bacterium]
MRIVAGRHRGARLEAPPGDTTRPTADRARQALFDTLTGGRFDIDLVDSAVLDVFAGTGALGLEALSRGAAQAAFIEKDRAALAALRHNIEHLKVENRCRVLAIDATRPGPATGPHADIVLMDAPYRSGIAWPALAALDAAGWLAANVLIVIELAKDEAYDLPAGLTVLDDRRYGAARFVFLGRVPG